MLLCNPLEECWGKCREPTILVLNILNRDIKVSEEGSGHTICRKIPADGDAVVMYNFGKVGFDPGHHAGANVGPGTYREGDVMLQLGLMLQKAYGVFLTRTTGSNITLSERSKLAANAGVNTLISLHTNAPEAAAGVIVFYSVRHPGDKQIAEYIGGEIARAIGLRFRGAATKPSTGNPQTDYFGIIRNPVQMGIKHPFIVEHGSHWEMAVNTEDKLAKIVGTYGRILQLGQPDQTPDPTTDNGPGKPPAKIVEIQGYVDILNKAVPQIIGEPQKWVEKAADDTDIYWLIRKTAAYIQAHKP